MTALCGNGYFIIGVALFGYADADKLFIFKNTLNINRKNCAALVNNAVKMNSSCFKSFHYRFCAAVARSNNLFILTEEQVNVSLGNKAFFKQGFNRFHNADKMVFHIERASAPDKFAVINPLKRRMLPIGFRAR